MAAACGNSSLGNSLVTLHKYLFCHFLSPLFLDDRNDAVGADKCAGSTAYASGCVGDGGRVVTLRVYLLAVHSEQLFGASGNAKSAALTSVGSEADFYHFKFPFGM
jgi:hypothetical protein